MKYKFLNLRVLTAIMMFAIVACGSDEDETPPADITVGNAATLTQTVYATGTPATVTFTTTGAWASSISEVKSSAPSWISVAPTSGTAAGEHTIAITLTPNASGADRAAAIAIASGAATITVNVTQRHTLQGGAAYNPNPTDPGTGNPSDPPGTGNPTDPPIVGGKITIATAAEFEARVQQAVNAANAGNAVTVEFTEQITISANLMPEFEKLLHDRITIAPLTGYTLPVSMQLVANGSRPAGVEPLYFTSELAKLIRTRSVWNENAIIRIVDQNDYLANPVIATYFNRTDANKNPIGGGQPRPARFDELGDMTAANELGHLLASNARVNDANLVAHITNPTGKVEFVPGNFPQFKDGNHTFYQRMFFINRASGFNWGPVNGLQVIIDCDKVAFTVSISEAGGGTSQAARLVALDNMFKDLFITSVNFANVRANAAGFHPARQ